MKINIILGVYGVIALGFCGGLLLFPAFWITLYGAQVDPQATLLIRLTAALFGGIGVMTWKSRNIGPSESHNAMILGLGVANSLAAIVAVFGAISGVYNRFAWGPVATFSVFAFAFVYWWARTNSDLPDPKRS